MSIINVIGYCESGQICYAESRVELAQQRVRAQRDGQRILTWHAQTVRGEQILGGRAWAEDATIQVPKLVTCQACGGTGCVVCNWSGICRKGHWEKWADWQLEAIRKEAQK